MTIMTSQPNERPRLSTPLGGFARRTATLLVRPFVLIGLAGFAPGLIAQQYCLSGAVTSVQNCTGCGLNVGDAVAMTFTVQPSSVNCSNSSGVGSCSANASVSANIGTQYWTSQLNPDPNNVLVIASSLPSPISQTNVELEGSAYPAPSQALSQSLAVTVLITFNGSLLSGGGGLPASLPLPNAVARSPMLSAGIVDGLANFSYTGQICAAAPASPPVISSVLNGATLQPTTLAANTYVTIKGTGLSSTNPGRQWAGPDFPKNSNGTLGLPTSLDGTSVTVNGTPAYVEYISPTQINIITPNIAATGNGIQVIVDTNAQPGTPVPITLQNLAPSFFAYYPGTANDGKYLVAQHAATSTDVGPAGLYAGAPANFTTPAKPGETIVLYGTGFGPTSPPIAPGIVTDKTYNLSPTPTATLGGIPATVGFAGLIAGFAQVYQFNMAIPTNAPNGDLPLLVNVNGTQSVSGLITVQAP
jgi:uncharacterized protein (TIGR03437 family)